MAELTVPDRYLMGIAKIINIDDNAFNALLSVLSKTEPTIDFDKYKSEIVNQLGEPEQGDLIDAMLSLYGACTGLDISRNDFVEDLYKAIQESRREELQFSPEIGDRFKDRLLKLLGNDQFAELMKAAEIQSEQNHIFLESRILSDIRPIFGPDVEATPIGGIVTHNLNICYSKGRMRKEFFVAMDNNDIEQLLAVLNRAKKKADSLKKMIDESSIRYIEVK